MRSWTILCAAALLVVAFQSAQAEPEMAPAAAPESGDGLAPAAAEVPAEGEGMPVAVLEASASGLPVISTRHGGISEAVVEGHTGFLVDEHDVPSMANRMLRVIEDATLAARLGQAGRRHIREHYSQADRLKRLASILEACATQRGSAGVGTAARACR